MNIDLEIWCDIRNTKNEENESDIYKKGVIKSIDPAKKIAIIKLSSEMDQLESKHCDNENFVCNLDKIYQTNSTSSEGFDDMVDMENLNEAELLENIKKRYEKNEIFTYVGPTLLVVNPYQNIPSVLAPETLTFYQKKIFELEFDLKKMKPHVYAISALSIRQLADTQKNQAIVISGESGAGKTENTKFAMKFLTSLGKNGIISK